MKPTLRTTKEGLVSVVVAFLNAERFLAEAIESVLAQTYAQWELMLVDDGSTDSGQEIAHNYAAQYPGRIHYLAHPGHQNLGMCTTRNLGVRNSKGEYIAVLDSDDVWFPQKLEQQVALMQMHPEIGLVYGHSKYWYDWTGDGLQTAKNHIDRLAPSGVYHPPDLLKLCYPLGKADPPCPSVFLLRRDLLDQVSGFEQAFDPLHQFFEDQALLAKVYLKAPVFVASETWELYRIHNKSWSAMSESSGRTDATRHFYFKWLEAYLRESKVEDKEIWRAFRQRTRRYRHPWLAKKAQVVRSTLGALRKFARLRIPAKAPEDR